MNQKELYGYTITADKHETYVDFTLYGGSDKQHDADLEPSITGYIKWDGCSNWKFHETQFHFCEKHQARDLGNLFSNLYDWAQELMPENDLSDVCRTPGSQFHIKVSRKSVEARIDLPIKLELTEEEAKKLDDNIHDALEEVLAPYFKV